MPEDKTSTAELLEAWREATRAADLAERLSKVAREALSEATRVESAAGEVAKLAEETAAAAARAAATARSAADDTARRVGNLRDTTLPDAEAVEAAARGLEGDARQRYHDRETDARARHKTDGPAS